MKKPMLTECNTAIILLLVLMLQEAVTTDNVFTDNDNSLLTCMVPGPDGLSIPEERRRLSIQPGEPQAIWLPMESG